MFPVTTKLVESIVKVQNLSISAGESSLNHTLDVCEKRNTTKCDPKNLNTSDDIYLGHFKFHVTLSRANPNISKQNII